MYVHMHCPSRPKEVYPLASVTFHKQRRTVSSSSSRHAALFQATVLDRVQDILLLQVHIGRSFVGFGDPDRLLQRTRVLEAVKVYDLFLIIEPWYQDAE